METGRTAGLTQVKPSRLRKTMNSLLLSLKLIHIKTTSSLARNDSRGEKPGMPPLELHVQVGNGTLRHGRVL